MADMMILEIPTERFDDVITLIDHMGWQVHDVDEAQLKAAQKVWAECGVEPDYAIHNTYCDNSLDFNFIMEFYPTEDTRVMIDAINAYLKDTATIDLHFTIGGNTRRLSGRLMRFYSGHDRHGKILGHVYHNLAGWWEVSAFVTI